MTNITQKIDMLSMYVDCSSWYNFAACNTNFVIKDVFEMEYL